jgi:hypothetical protein
MQQRHLPKKARQRILQRLLSIKARQNEMMRLYGNRQELWRTPGPEMT